MYHLKFFVKLVSILKLYNNIKITYLIVEIHRHQNANGIVILVIFLALVELENFMGYCKIETGTQKRDISKSQQHPKFDKHLTNEDSVIIDIKVQKPTSTWDKKSCRLGW